MRVTNNTSFPIIAFGSHRQRGYGDDVTIEPGTTQEVSGPYLGEMGGGKCHVHIEGELACHELADDGRNFQVIPGTPLCLRITSDIGITVRHHLDPVEDQVAAWRQDVTTI